MPHNTKKNNEAKRLKKKRKRAELLPSSDDQQYRVEKRYKPHHSNPHHPYLSGRKEPPKITSKHQSYLEIVPNPNKKKHIDIVFSNNPDPPPHYTLVPAGNAQFTKACMEASREQGAQMIIITYAHVRASEITMHTSRLGCHFMTSIVDAVSQKLVAGGMDKAKLPNFLEYKTVKPIPATQQEVWDEANAMIVDLFPRIPNTDREQILKHQFTLGIIDDHSGKARVGLAAQLPLFRRVGLAVQAHVRHTQTAYDDILRTKVADWHGARAACEEEAIRFLKNWRSDAETGRGEEDEIIRETVTLDESDNEAVAEVKAKAVAETKAEAKAEAKAVANAEAEAEAKSEAEAEAEEMGDDEAEAEDSGDDTNDRYVTSTVSASADVSYRVPTANNTRSLFMGRTDKKQKVQAKDTPILSIEGREVIDLVSDSEPEAEMLPVYDVRRLRD